MNKMCAPYFIVTESSNWNEQLTLLMVASAEQVGGINVTAGQGTPMKLLTSLMISVYRGELWDDLGKWEEFDAGWV